MTHNPYASPESADDAVNAPTTPRRQAMRSFRMLLLVLLAPAIYNLYEFDAMFVNPLSAAVATICRVMNIGAFVIACALIWFLGMPILVAVARLLRWIFASRVNPTAWLDTFFHSFDRARLLAFGGAALWFVWVFGFYRMHWDFYALSWSVGVSAHLLAACWYVPLFYRWFQLGASRTAFDQARYPAINPTDDWGS